AAREEITIAENVEGREFQLLAAHPRQQRDVGTDAGGLTEGQRKGEIANCGVPAIFCPNLHPRSNLQGQPGDIQSSRPCGFRPDRPSTSARLSAQTSFHAFPFASACRWWSACGRTAPPFRYPAWSPPAGSGGRS